MRKIMASLDIGSSSIKLVVGEIQKNKLNVLSCVEILSGGIKKGYIVNPESALPLIKEAFAKTEQLIGLPIKKVLINVPSYNLECFMTSGYTTITSEDKVITHKDLIRAMQASVYNKISDNKELVTILPTKYILNDEEVVTNPVNMIANKLTVNAVAVVLPKKNTENIIKCLEKLDIKVVDIVVEPLADYYQFKESSIANKTGAIVNIGQSNTIVSIFNKGILTACEVIDIGASAIDSDLAYVFKISKKEAYDIKEKIVTTDIHLADPAESVLVTDINKESIKINQYDASSVAISRLNEIMGLIKKQINLLTKKEISYIIVSGGISELSNFASYLENYFGSKVKIANVNDMGARHNKYSVVLGTIKYYNSRLKLRNSEFSIFSLEEQEEFGASHKRINLNENSLLGKIFGYFFDN